MERMEPDRAASEFVFERPLAGRDALRAAISRHVRADEDGLVQRLLDAAVVPSPRAEEVVARAAGWVRSVRRLRHRHSALDAFLHEYDLSSAEGVTLMCLAEALLRIPDDGTAEALVADRLADADWERHLGHSDSLFVNASTWGLMLTGRWIRPPERGDAGATLAQLVGRRSESVIRAALRHAMRVIGSQFVMGRDIGAALERATSREQRGWLHSFDMLGEAALTAEDAQRYFDAYAQAIHAIGACASGAELHHRPGVSVKLSALHPRYEFACRERVLCELTPRLRELALAACKANIGLCVDAEEADRLELSLDVFERVYRDDGLDGWEGFGLAVQAFQKRAPFVVDWLVALARQTGRRIPVRLVKGAYWDTEVKRAQQGGLRGYPCFTRKLGTDVCYLVCARKLLAARDAIYPQFATHNAHTIAAVCDEAAHGGDADGSYEFQRLHGMGEALYAVVREEIVPPCRVYAPVGSHADLLPYLVRRLLENGANTSFVNRIFDAGLPAEQVVADPIAALAALPVKANPALPLPAKLYGARRRNSAGLDLTDEATMRRFAQALVRAPAPGRVESLLAGTTLRNGPVRSVFNPADHRQTVGEWLPLAPECVDGVMATASAACSDWDATTVDTRARQLERAAGRLEKRRAAFIRLLVLEAGKTLGDALAEVRETVDLLRYYAAQARELLALPQPLSGPTGEANELQLHGRGVCVCISPWNFPLSIFTGQVAAALVAGNPVIAKPAEQTNLVAVQMVRLLHAAGVPAAALQCCLGDGELGAALVADSRVAVVLFTGATDTARAINRSLAARDAPIATLVAETGGQNAMIVDSSALPEQVVHDVVASAFGAAGQRCSALRVLCLQKEIADRVIGMLRGAMRERCIGDPRWLSTDVGPVIDAEALCCLRDHAEALRACGRVVEQLPLSPECGHGTFFAPLLAEIPSIDVLDREHFGPILHLLRYAARDLDATVDAINATGYGLTLGVHSRIETTWRRIQTRARVGNVYVNRGMTGAVVGSQPFGGESLSGTGPKAGGPHYLLRLVTERTLSVNTTAIGGNAQLLAGG